MKLLQIFLVTMLSIGAFYANAAGSGNTIGVYVLNTGTYGDGSFFIEFDRNIDEPECPSQRIDVAPKHPQMINWLNLASTAFTNNLPVTVRTFGCYRGRPTLSKTGIDSWFHLGPK